MRYRTAPPPGRTSFPWPRGRRRRSPAPGRWPRELLDVAARRSHAAVLHRYCFWSGSSMRRHRGIELVEVAEAAAAQAGDLRLAMLGQFLQPHIGRPSDLSDLRNANRPRCSKSLNGWHDPLGQVFFSSGWAPPGGSCTSSGQRAGAAMRTDFFAATFSCHRAPCVDI